jgi:Protein of unknown function (DUF3455)
MSSLRRVSIVAAAAALSLSLAPSAGAAPSEPVVPSDIAVPAGHKVFLVGHAVGVQIYRCTATGWGLVAPRANLYGDGGNLITTHFGGPTWQARDGSKVVGKRDGDAPGAPGAIPWLRLAAASTSAGADGDRLEGTTYIQRIATAGGVAPPAAECDAAAAGAEREVPYTADYVFWKLSA